MREIWKALIARIIHWLTPKPIDVLKPGMCECGHWRCAHKKGILNCTVNYKNGASVCVCEVFILKKDSGGNDPCTPSPEELERIYGVK